MLYAANIARPDVARTASKLSEFSRNPSPIHNAAATRAIAYLYQTKTLAIEYLKENIMNHIFARASNASFRDDSVSRKSTEGYLFTLFRRTGLFGPIGRSIVMSPDNFLRSTSSITTSRL